MSIFEAIMLLCFGAAWPMNIYKSWKARTAAGKSLMFQIAVAVGYISGITHKILYNNDVVLYLYIINFIMLSIDTTLWFRNHKLDLQREAGTEAAITEAE
jgi:hypothetical protein